VKTLNLLTNIRIGLSHLPINDKHIALSELIGLSLANSFIDLKGRIISSFENPQAARRLILILDFMGVPHSLSSYIPNRFGGVSGHKYEITFSNRVVYSILTNHDYIYEVSILPVGFLRSLFLARGNLYISTRGGYRLTFASRYRFALDYASDYLSEYRFSFALQKRPNKDIWFLHITKFDEIVALLNLFGAHAAVEKLLEIHGAREVKKNITRITNIELANLRRISYTSGRQYQKLSRLDERDVPVNLRPLWKLRMSSEGSLMSYKELANALGWTKSRVSRGLRKLEKLAEKEDHINRKTEKQDSDNI